MSPYTVLIGQRVFEMLAKTAMPKRKFRRWRGRQKAARRSTNRRAQQ